MLQPLEPVFLAIQEGDICVPSMVAYGVGSAIVSLTAAVVKLYTAGQKKDDEFKDFLLHELAERKEQAS